MKASVVFISPEANSRVSKVPMPCFEDFDDEPSVEVKSTASTANGRLSVNPDDEQDTDESVEARVVRATPFRPSERKQRGRVSLNKKSFKQELEKLGHNARQILERNPTKLCTSRGPSPERDQEEKVMLPFQRRARSNSPIREELDLTKRQQVNLFPCQGPVKARKPVLKKQVLVDAFSGIVEDEEASSAAKEDEELEILKMEYSRLLDQTTSVNKEKTEEPEKVEEVAKGGSKPKRSKITFM